MSNAAIAIDTSRLAAYTGARSDIFELVPAQARSILDLGCSDGTLGRALKDQNPERFVAGIEYSQELADRAGRQLDFVLRKDLNLPQSLEDLGDRSFDCVICADVLEHLQQPDELLQRLRRHLRPGASLIVSLPNIRHLSAFASIFLGGSFPRRSRGIFDDTHLRWFTIRDGRHMLDANGFDVQKTTYALRWGDKGGGRANKLLIRLFGSSAHALPPVREFLSYQFAMHARLRPESGGSTASGRPDA